MVYNTGDVASAYYTTYEELEWLFAKFYLSLEPLRNSPKDKVHYDEANRILTELAKFYNIQPPERAITNPRTQAKFEPFDDAFSM